MAETTVELPLPNRTGGSVGLRQVHRQAVDGTQIPVLTSRTDLPAAEVCWRLAARWRQENYSRADDEARALLREAFTLSGDLHITGDTLHVRLDPATAPRRSRALHALCQQLAETGTRYPTPT